MNGPMKSSAGGARMAEWDSPCRIRPPACFWPGILPRNLLFFLIVLAHGFRRIFPPY